MRRLRTAPRPDWQTTIHNQGLTYAESELPDGTKFSYWNEGEFYSFSIRDIEVLEAAGAQIFEMLIEAGDHIVANPEIMRKMAIPEFAWDMIIRTWNDEPAWQSVYGRYDLRFGGVSHPLKSMRVPKLYEFNADTPTCLVESAYVQWEWAEDTGMGNDQHNSIQEKLIKAWKRNLGIAEQKLGFKPIVHFACISPLDEPSGEDIMNTMYLMDACEQAGYQTRTMYMHNITKGEDGRFYDDKGNHIDVIFKLYPWEFMVEQDYAEACFEDMKNVGLRDPDGNYIGGTVWIEPPYKMLWANKGILAVLWDLFKGTDKAKYLIPAWFEGEEPSGLKNYVVKPMLGREGANVIIHKDGVTVLEVPGEYGAEGNIVQRFAPPPEFYTSDNKAVHPVCGLWMIDGEVAGLGIRESFGYVTDNLSFFVPHVLSDSPIPTITPVGERTVEPRLVTYVIPTGSTPSASAAA